MFYEILSQNGELKKFKYFAVSEKLKVCKKAFSLLIFSGKLNNPTVTHFPCGISKEIVYHENYYRFSEIFCVKILLLRFLLPF